MPIIFKINSIVNKRVPIIGVGGIETLDDLEDARKQYGYDLFAIGLAALADPNLVDHLQDGVEPIKVFSKDSILPPNLIERIQSWSGLEKRGYSFK